MALIDVTTIYQAHCRSCGYLKTDTKKSVIDKFATDHDCANIKHVYSREHDRLRQYYGIDMKGALDG